MIIIRKIENDEYEFLREMLYQAIYLPDENQELPESIVFEPSLSKYVENFGRKGDFAFVLVCEDDLVGAVWTRLFNENAESYGFIDEHTPELSIAITKIYRNKGFGSKLIRKMLEKLKSEGFKKVSLSVDKRNQAVNLYKRTGFKVVSEKDTAYTMLKKLK
jgi:ribosomal protein S18 acetylase RimI-like enzyme